MTGDRYSVSGFSVKSAVPLFGLALAEGAGPCEFTVSRMDRGVRDVPPEWPPERITPRDVIRRSEGDPGAWWLRGGDDQAHRVRPAAGLVEVAPGSTPGLPLTHGVVDFALPNLLSCGDRLVLHGALLETGNGCVAGLGDSGVGKSTLAARWVRAGRRFLSDDWFVVRPDGDRLLAFPSHPSLRLRERDAELSRFGGVEEVDGRPAFSKVWYSFKAGSNAFCAEPRELLGVAFLSRPGSGTGAIQSAPIGPRAAMARFVSSLILLELDSRDRWGFLLPLFSRLEREMKREELHIPEGTEHLADVVEALEGAHAHGR